MMGVFTLFAYLVPLLTTVSGMSMQYVPWVLFGMGFCGFFGNLAGGAPRRLEFERHDDRHSRAWSSSSLWRCRS